MLHPHTPATRTVAVAFAALAVLGLSACSGDDDKQDKPAKAASSPTSIDPSRLTPTNLPDVPEIAEAKGAVADASFGSCATNAGDTNVTGTITSSAAKARDYVVTVSWVNATSDVLGRGVAVVRNVAPKTTHEFLVSATVPKGATTCTFQVLRGRVG